MFKCEKPRNTRDGEGLQDYPQNFFDLQTLQRDQ